MLQRALIVVEGSRDVANGAGDMGSCEERPAGNGDFSARLPGQRLLLLDGAGEVLFGGGEVTLLPRQTGLKMDNMTDGARRPTAIAQCAQRGQRLRNMLARAVRLSIRERHPP